MEITEGTPSLFNDPALTARVVESLKSTLGPSNVDEGEPSMGGEDFSRYGLAGVPICMFRLGAVKQARLDEFGSKGLTPPSLHSPQFYPDTVESLSVGVPAMANVALDLLSPEASATEAKK
jgi:hippurate hydrolase